MSTKQDDYATSVVPSSERKSVLNLTLVWTATVITVSGLMTGATVAGGLEFADAMWAILLGNLMLVVVGGLTGMIGAKEGVSATMLARHAFGRQGSKIVAVCVGIVMLGWFSVQIFFFGQAMQAMFPGGGWLVEPNIAAIWGGVLMTATAYMGYRGLSMISTIAVPALLILVIIGISAVLGDGGWDSLSTYAPAAPMTMGVAIGAVFGSFAAAAAVHADIMRYAKDTRDAWISTIIGSTLGNALVICGGYMITAATGNADLPAAMVALGLGVPALLVLVLAQWTTNDSNLYWSSLSFSNIINLPKKTIVLISGALGVLASLLGLATNFIGFLLTLGITITPFAGILITDYFLVSKGKYKFGKGTKYSQWGGAAIISWLGASILAYHIQWGIGGLNAFVLSGVIYFVIAKVMNAKIAVGETTEQADGF